jgi:hypothetical protein
VLSIFISHVFSAFLARQAELHERPSRSGQMKIIRTELRFLLLAAPALALLIILTAAGPRRETQSRPSSSWRALRRPLPAIVQIDVCDERIVIIQVNWIG